ncbi:MAG: hypothetical protein HJJLKODD_01360 [Phycisphaerae bacterium]|nr:hypothetical protein [Phycisphaerae bacterium]
MVNLHPQFQPFSLAAPSKGMKRLLYSLMSRPLEKLLHFPELNGIYLNALLEKHPGNFIDRVLEEMGVAIDVDAEQLQRIPTSGPVVLVANHPFGGLEGLVLISLIQRVRPDIKVLANYLLHSIIPLREHMIFVDPFGRADSARFNITPMKESLAWLKQGGALGVFPAGEVSSLDLKRREVSDPPWSKSVARLIRRAEAPVVPVFFEGRNDALFQMAGLVHPRLRTMMLPHAFVKCRGKSMRVHVGSAITSKRLAQFESPVDLIEYLRMRTYIQRPDLIAPKAVKSVGPEAEVFQSPVAPRGDLQEMLREISELPPSQCLVENGEYQVFLARTPQIPAVLQEIGRLREITFRRAGEGSGKALDLDQFDEYYQHLFLWNKPQQELVGAYRIGLTDEILKRFGPRGLYTSTLFKFSPRLFHKLNPAAEMGRSFVRWEYQRKHSSLTLLWQGIGRFVAQQPRYKLLFGPVSINRDYSTISQQMMIAFLKNHSLLPDLARYVKPRNPPRWRLPHELPQNSRLLEDIDEISSLVSEVEADQKGVPILLRQYLRLNAKFLGCNVDPDFSDVLDGLMLTDLTQTDQRILERHMGKDGLQKFLTYHHLPPIVRTASSAAE